MSVVIKQQAQAFFDSIPFSQELGIRLGDVSAGRCEMHLPYAEFLVGNPVTGVLHGGCITSLLDACCGGAVLMTMERFTPFATLDLRIDYLRPARKGCDIIATAHCYKTTSQIAFVRCEAKEKDGEVVATGQSTFMLDTKGAVPGE